MEGREGVVGWFWFVLGLCLKMCDFFFPSVSIGMDGLSLFLMDSMWIS